MNTNGVRIFEEVGGVRRDVTPDMATVHWAIERLKLGMVIYEPKGNERFRSIGFFDKADKRGEPLQDSLCRYLLFTGVITEKEKTRHGNFYRLKKADAAPERNGNHNGKKHRK